MISRLLRRLQGHAPAPALQAATATGVYDAPAAMAEPIAPAPAFVRHLLDAAPEAAVTPGLCNDVLERLGALARHLDVARLPRLPAAVPQLLAALRRGDDSSALATVLSRDPTLVGDVLRVANSAHHARVTRATSLPQAVTVLGGDGLRYVVLTTVVRPIVQADPTQQGARTGERLVRHGEARTWLCGALAPGRCDAGEAQLASIVATTGLAALLRMMPRTLLAQASADDAFAPAFLALAGELSARAATHWRLDDATRAALSAFGSGDVESTALSRTLASADRLAMLHVLDGAAPQPGSTPDADARLLAALREALAD